MNMLRNMSTMMLLILYVTFPSLMIKPLNLGKLLYNLNSLRIRNSLNTLKVPPPPIMYSKVETSTITMSYTLNQSRRYV